MTPCSVTAPAAHTHTAAGTVGDVAWSVCLGVGSHLCRKCVVTLACQACNHMATQAAGHIPHAHVAGL
eukprot:110613-Chlamydomonas_euryale.AAC.1